MGSDENLHVAYGYDADILLRWGNPIYEGSPKHDVMNQTAAVQLQQFGCNDDFTELDEICTRSLLFGNHEYASQEVIFPDLGSRIGQVLLKWPEKWLKLELLLMAI